ncbi:aggregation-promoting factor C-terminal-like domain-containing protein [Actinomadura craniellae]|uniref:aggregation-promoting factor C-terminal-like domain-containing protein n=1 Tax=Actinomadura craniellae TaxID=2231787 RepID=UPI0018F18CDE|nr:lytic transglycosylase domain-containing protein [Actinomadura craniellae]
MPLHRVKAGPAKTAVVALTTLLGAGLAVAPAPNPAHAGRAPADPPDSHAHGEPAEDEPARTTVRARRLTRVVRNKLIAWELMDRRRWASEHQFRCLDRLWTRESGWNHRAHNSRTGAHGIPQAHPGGKMATAGDDWRTNPRTQIKWGLRYIRSRHGTPCGAWRHLRATGWY